MTKDQIESAVASGIPFTLRMADGKEYVVRHADYISFPPKSPFVIVYDERGHSTVLPFRTVTALESKLPENGGEA